MQTATNAVKQVAIPDKSCSQEVEELELQNEAQACELFILKGQVLVPPPRAAICSSV